MIQLPLLQVLLQLLLWLRLIAVSVLVLVLGMRNNIAICQMVFKEFIRHVWIIKVEILQAHIKLSLCTFLMRVLNSHLGGVDMSPLTIVFKIISWHKELRNELFPLNLRSLE